MRIGSLNGCLRYVAVGDTFQICLRYVLDIALIVLVGIVVLALVWYSLS